MAKGNEGNTKLFAEDSIDHTLEKVRARKTQLASFRCRTYHEIYNSWQGTVDDLTNISNFKNNFTKILKKGDLMRDHSSITSACFWLF